MKACRTSPVPLDTKVFEGLGDYGRALMAAFARGLGQGASSSARSTAIATRRPPVIAPTGTIGLVMDCDTTGIEPDFALVKFKKLAGGGYFKIINRAVPEALRALGYRESEIAEIEAYAVGHGSLSNAPGINHSTLQGQGLHRRGDRQGREGACRPRSTSSSPSTSGRSARISSATRSASRPRRSPRRISTCSPRSVSPSARSRPPTSTSAAR